MSGLDDLDAIVKVPGIDAIFLGPMDLSFSLSVPAEPGHPTVREAIRSSIDKITSAGTAADVLVTMPEEFHKFAAMGARYLPMVMVSLMAKALRDNIAAIQRAGS